MTTFPDSDEGRESAEFSDAKLKRRFLGRIDRHADDPAGCVPVASIIVDAVGWRTAFVSAAALSALSALVVARGRSPARPVRACLCPATASCGAGSLGGIVFSS